MGDEIFRCGVGMNLNSMNEVLIIWICHGTVNEEKKRDTVLHLQNMLSSFVCYVTVVDVRVEGYHCTHVKSTGL